MTERNDPNILTTLDSFTNPNVTHQDEKYVDLLLNEIRAKRPGRTAKQWTLNLDSLPSMRDTMYRYLIDKVGKEIDSSSYERLVLLIFTQKGLPNHSAWVPQWLLKEVA
jgi:hypothetical protein